MDEIDAILRANDLVAVLGRDIPVRLLDISASGCLLESANRLDAGTTGTVRVVYRGIEYSDDIRVMRCQGCEGSSGAYHVGAEFLWTSRPPDRSLRRVVATLPATAVKAGRFDRTHWM
jgi:hypothetical protein